MDLETGIQLDYLDHIAPSIEELNSRNSRAGTSDYEDEASLSFLQLIALLQSFQIHPVNVYLIDSLGLGAIAATGSLGKGGQYLVDRVFGNQRSVIEY